MGAMNIKNLKQTDKRNARMHQGLSAEPFDIGADPDGTDYAEYGVINSRYTILNLNYREKPAIYCKSQLDAYRKDQTVKANEATQ